MHIHLHLRQEEVNAPVFDFFDLPHPKRTVSPVAYLKMSRKKAKHRAGQSQDQSKKSTLAKSPTSQARNMPHSIDQTKSKAINENDKSAKISATAKRPRFTDDINTGLEPSPIKKARLQNSIDRSTNEAATGTKDKPVETSGDHPATADRVETARVDSLPNEVRHLASQYDFTLMSIISSSKMEQKIRNILERLSNFSFADPTIRPGVVVLHAKVEAASKMVGIAELVKREIEKSKGRWWQYSKLEGQILEKKTKPAQRTGGGMTLREWEAQQIEAKEAVNTKGGSNAEPEAKDVSSDESGEEEEAAFETMAPPPTRAEMGILAHEGRMKVRATPIMTIYLSRVPVPGLKALYGFVLSQSFVFMSTSTDAVSQGANELERVRVS